MLQNTPKVQTACGTTNLGDLIERVLDKGIVISGDIRIKLVDVELLTIQLRLVICSVEKAAEIGLDWWNHDPHFAGSAARVGEMESLHRRLDALETLPGARAPSGRRPVATRRRGTSRRGVTLGAAAAAARG